VKTVDIRIEEVETLAKEVLKLKREAIPRRPIIIEFCGSPKAGKSSCINSLDLFLRRNNFRTKILTERASVCPVLNKFDPSFNLWTISSAMAELVEILSNHAKDYDVILMDRGIFDALCWFSWQLEKKHLDNENFIAIEGFLTMSKWRSVLDLIYVFTASSEESLRRENANLLTRKTGRIMQKSVLNSYKGTIESSVEKYKTVFQRVEKFDTSSTAIDEVNYTVTKNILEILRENTTEKIGYIPRDVLSDSLPEFFGYNEAINSDIRMLYGVRTVVESDDQKVQPLPIVVITNKERNRVLLVKKNKDSVSNNSPEKNKNLLYLGGHIRQEDEYQTKSKEMLDIIRLSLHREVKEEVNISIVPSEKQEDIFCIWNRDNPKSSRHLAVCYIFEIDFDTTKFQLAKDEFMVASNSKSGKVIAIEEIRKMNTEAPDGFEAWSRVIMEKVFGIMQQEKLL
jgi:predicted NUDIX family phosphoesterase